MSGYALSSVALGHRDAILAYLLPRSPQGAVTVYDALDTAFALLSTQPDIGYSRPRLTRRPFKFWPVLSYLVIYDPASTPLMIHGIVHGARDWAEVLDDLP